MKRVIRPGPFQYVWLLLLPTIFPFGLGVPTLLYGFNVQPPDWPTRLPWGLGLIGFGVIGAAVFFGTTVEVSDWAVSKVFLYGLFRETIPIDKLSAHVDEQPNDPRMSHHRVMFQRADGPGAFALYRTYGWRESDVDELVGLASQPWNSEAILPLHRQHRRLLLIVWLVGLAAFGMILVVLRRTGPNG